MIDAQMFFDGWRGPARVLIVGALAYLALIALLRASGNRTLSKMNAFDFVVTVALGSTLATVLLSRDVPLLEGVLALALLIGLQFLITWLSARSRWISRLIKSEPILLVHKGQILERALKQARVIETEILQAIREQGLGSVEEVEALVLETDGAFSVVNKTPGDDRTALANVVGRRP